MVDEAVSAPEDDVIGMITPEYFVCSVSMACLIIPINGASMHCEMVADLNANLCLSILSYTGWMCIL